MDGEIGRIVVGEAELSALHNLLADGLELGVARSPEPLPGVEVNLGEDELGDVLGDTSVGLGRNGVFKQIHIVFEFLLEERQHKGPVLRVRIVGGVLVYGIRHGAPAIHCKQVVIGPEDLDFGYVPLHGLGLHEFLQLVESIVAGGNTVEAEVPGAAHELVARRDGVFLQFHIAGLAPAAVVGLRDGHFIGQLHNHREHTLLGAPALESGIRSCGVECHIGILLQELFLRNLGINLLIQIRAGCSKGCKCCNHYDISFHLNFFLGDSVRI